jgi:hypothetical protein
VKERRTAVQRATGIAGSVAAAVRRRQQAREPRALLYDRTGEPLLLRPEAPGYDDVLTAAELLVEEVVDEREEPAADEDESSVYGPPADEPPDDPPS